MSSSSATATVSRSPSPATPESSSDSLEPAIHNPFNTLIRPGTPSNDLPSAWDASFSFHIPVRKPDEEHMLCLNDLIEENAYDDSQTLAFNPTVYQISPDFDVKSAMSAIGAMRHFSSPNGATDPSSFCPPPDHNSTNKSITPSFSRPHKQDPGKHPQKVIYPPRESCQNLSILVPNIPQAGTKSRVETQVRVAVELADTSTGGESSKYDRIGSWNWLKLPPGTATKKRTRKQGKIDPAIEDTLHLTASVTCASPPYSQVLSCSSCQAREAKRVARKLAARVRPVRSDSDSPQASVSQPPTRKFKGEDTTSIIQFNCAEVQDFSTGSVVLPLRITCYCRHHREKVGFLVHLTMVDHLGRLVATGTTRPIMITDDHKSTGVKQGGVLPSGYVHGSLDWEEWPQFAHGTESPDRGAPSKRKSSTSKAVHAKLKKRAKPYEVGRTLSRRPSREASVTSFYSPPSVSATLPGTRSPTPPQYLTSPDSQSSSMVPPTMISELDASSIVRPRSVVQPPDPFSVADVLMPGPTPFAPHTPEAQHVASPVLQSPTMNMPQPVSQPLIHMPYMFFNQPLPPPVPNVPVPKIHRLIPNTGPTFGGIEVTVLGSDFHPSLQLKCVFGDMVASSTHLWSDNTLVCVLPPRAVPGVVEVWFDGIPKQEGDPSSSFSYTDESDRALMELALQVVGLKMTGKIQDAKNVAMRIVGNASDSEPTSAVDSNNMMQISSAISASRPLLLMRASDQQDYESLIVNFLRILDADPPADATDNATSISDAISLQRPSGQTLLHLAASLGFARLVQFAIDRGIDLDARDRNGYTALHFAVLGGSRPCARMLLEAGADPEIVNALGKRPDEIGQPRCEDGEQTPDSDGVVSEEEEDDEEADWGDGEDDARDDFIRLPRRRVAVARGLRRVEMSASVADTPDVPAPPKVAESVPADAKKAPAPPPPMPPAGSKVDEKQAAASFVDVIQRTLAQLHARQGNIIPTMPQLPLLPNMPWAVALPQIPTMVFPVFVPMPFLGSLLGEKRGSETAAAAAAAAAKVQEVGGDGGLYMGALRAAQDTMEKCMAMAARQREGGGATTTEAGTSDKSPPPRYTPRVEGGEGAGPSTVVRPGVEKLPPPLLAARRCNYEPVPVTDQEVNAYAYRPTAGQAQRLQKKHDKMLILFWIPILFLSLLYGLYTGMQELFHFLRTAIPLKTGIRA